MLKLKTLAFVLILSLVASGCQSVPSAPPQTKLMPVTCPAPPSPPAWMMEPSEPNFTQRLLDALSGLEEMPTNARGS